MTALGDHFILLEAESETIRGSQLLTRSVGLTIGGREFLVGVDALRQKHALIPAGEAAVEADVASQGVTLQERVLRLGDEDVRYIDLACQLHGLDAVFEHLVDDVVQRLALDSSRPVATCQSVLDEWRALLRSASRPTSREIIVGLVGELELVRRLSATNPSGALASWVGPRGAIHDFVSGAEAIEVKTTSSVDGNYVSISNVDQLDPALVNSLHLLVVHAREDPAAPSLDERIDEIVDLGASRQALLQRVADAGYTYGIPPMAADRYAVRSVRGWRVGREFPGLRRNEIGEGRLLGVSRIRYELALDSAPRCMPPDELDGLLDRWGAGK